MFTVNRSSTKRLKLLVDMLNSEDLISGKVEVARNNAIALFKNDEEIFSFCIDEFLDTQVIDLCNALVTIYDCVEDRFVFSHYVDYYTRQIFFAEKDTNELAGIGVTVSSFPDSISLDYRGRGREKASIDEMLKFESLEKLSDNVYKFLDKIEELD